MAFPPRISLFSLVLTLNFLCFPLQMNCLSTVSISHTSSKTLVCAIFPTSSNQQTILNCTSFPSGVQIPISQNVSYSRIVGGNGFLCALRSQPVSSPYSVMECWRFSSHGTNMSHKRIYRGAVLSELEASNSHVCGLVNGTNDLKCWQWGQFDPNSLSHPSFSAIGVGESFLCGLDRNSTIFCTGKNAGVVTGEQPRGKYSVIGAGSHHACAISLNGSLDCWGNMAGNKPEGEFMELALGDDRSCAMRDNGTVVCWGKNDFRMPTRLQETYFIGIVAKKNVFCGVVSANYSVLCWGNEFLAKANFLVFSDVMPGPCMNQCPCDPLPGYGKFCGIGLMVCQPCARERTLEQSSSPKVPESPPKSRKNWSAKMVTLLVIGCLGSVSLLASLAFIMVMRYRGGRGSSRIHDSGRIEVAEKSRRLDYQRSRQGSEDQQRPSPVLEKRLSHMYSMRNGGNLEEFSLEVLLQVTNNFSQDQRVGVGSFGSVYRATFGDGREVAIKRADNHLSPASAWGIQRRQEKDIAFMTELEFLSRLNHKHLVKLLGFCEDVNERILVYEFMSNGTVYDHLHKLKDSSPLVSWPARIKVALDAARGIEYLHEYAVPSIIHRDIKPSNILLDDDWTAKVSDFGLSSMGPQQGESYVSLCAAGTLGYVDPEYYRLHQLTTRSDIYSFGVVLLELLTGFKAIHTNEDGSPRNVVDFVVPYIMRDEIHRVLDPHVPPPTPVEIEAVTYVGYLAVDCVSQEARSRPPMTVVVGCLERALAACLDPPTLSSSSTMSSQ